MGEWLIPFKGRNFCGANNVNFVWQHENIYIMDNHRVALWCWYQHITTDDPINIFHIDWHTDVVPNTASEQAGKCPDLSNISLDYYLSIVDKVYLGIDVPLFIYNNYLSIFMVKHSHSLKTCVFATYNDGADPEVIRSPVEKILPWELPGILNSRMQTETGDWICNLDLDYFFFLSGFNRYDFLFSDQYVERLASSIKEQLGNGKIKVLTISLSPEHCGGWENAEKICAKVCTHLDLPFELIHKF